MKTLVWLPAYNEEVNVDYMIDELEKEGLEFVLSDGFSTDRTVELAKSRGAKIVMRSGPGKGDSIRDGLAYASANNFEALALIDCDRTYPVDKIPELIHLLRDADMVVGNRSMKDIAFLRRMGNILMTGILNLMYRSSVGDMASGMRVLRVSKFTGKLTAGSFDIEPQIYCVALRHKYRVIQHDIPYFKREGDSKINVGHLFLLIWRIVIERFKGIE